MIGMEPLLAVLLACSSPRYQDKVDAVMAGVSTLSTGTAKASLHELRGKTGDEGLRGHPALAALLAVRVEGLGPKRAVYCAEKGGHWVGVEAEDGRLFRLPVAADGDVDMSRFAEVKRPLPDRRREFELATGALAAAAAFGSPLAGVSMPAVRFAAGPADKELRDALAPLPLTLPAVPYGAYCAARGCRSRSARATIDTDGWIADPVLREKVSSEDFDRHHQPITSMAYEGRSEDDPARFLDSTRVPYVVRHRDSPWGLGDLVVIEHGGRRLVAIVGDEGRRRRVNEVSYAAAVRLSIDPDGNSGGTDGDDPIKITRLTGFKIKAPRSEGEILGTLGAVQVWVDGREASSY